MRNVLDQLINMEFEVPVDLYQFMKSLLMLKFWDCKLTLLETTQINVARNLDAENNKIMYVGSEKLKKNECTFFEKRVSAYFLTLHNCCPSHFNQNLCFKAPTPTPITDLRPPRCTSGYAIWFHFFFGF